MTELSKSGSASRRSVMSWQTVNLRCFLVFEENFWNHFCTQLAYFQVFSEDFSHCVSANRKLLRNHSHSQSTISTHQLLHSIDVAISPACQRPARFDRPHILLDLFGIVLFLCKLAVATLNIPKVSYQA